MFVSHRLEEVFEISQRITVMRDGHVVASAPADQSFTRRRRPKDGRTFPRRALSERRR
jgi:ABC-type sugar transport system ATPase subunit